MAIATARRLGAVVEAYDLRPEVKEQVESLGADFIEIEVPESDTTGDSGYAKAQSEAFYTAQRQQLADCVARRRPGNHHGGGARKTGSQTD